MTQYVPIKFTHAFLKEDDQKTPRAVYLTLGAIAGYHKGRASDPTKIVVECTQIYTIGGIFPVLETEEQVDMLIKSVHTTINQTKGE